MGRNTLLKFASMCAGRALDGALGVRDAQDSGVTDASDDGLTPEPGSGATAEPKSAATVWADGSESAKPAHRGECLLELSLAPKDKVDLLFVIDNSATVAKDQTALTQVLPQIAHALTAPANPIRPYLLPDFPSFTRLHVGIVSTGLGVNLPCRRYA